MVNRADEVRFARFFLILFSTELCIRVRFRAALRLITNHRGKKKRKLRKNVAKTLAPI